MGAVKTMFPDKWEFIQDESGDIKKVLCNGDEIMASGLNITYSPSNRIATITIQAMDFSIRKDSTGASVLGKE